jgi:hypothetical protein
MSDRTLEPSAFTWSVRECLERAQRLVDAERHTGELNQAAWRELAIHALHNLKGGMALPPTPALEPTRRPSPPVMFTRAGPAPQPLHANVRAAAPAPGPKAAAKARAEAEDLLNTEKLCKVIGVGRTRLYRLRDEGIIEPPHRVESGMPFWTREQALRARQAHREGKR